MNQTKHYIQWQKPLKTPDQQISEIMKHWEVRFELGTAMLLCDDSSITLKVVQKNWRKLTRQLQTDRNMKLHANDILELTRKISRMQRVKFTTKSPESEPDATFYIVEKESLHSLSQHCQTFYSPVALPEVSVLKQLPSESLVMALQEKTDLPGFYPKSALEEQVQTDESMLLNWLEAQSISLEALENNMEKSNEALDTLLSSSNLQSEFIAKTQLFLHTLQLAQPLKLSEFQQLRLKNLQKLEQHVRVLSPAFLSDHILDSQNDDSFLLRDPATGRALTLSSIKAAIKAQHKAGRAHLASALEQKAGFVSIM